MWINRPFPVCEGWHTNSTLFGIQLLGEEGSKTGRKEREVAGGTRRRKLGSILKDTAALAYFPRRPFGCISVWCAVFERCCLAGEWSYRPCSQTPPDRWTIYSDTRRQSTANQRFRFSFQLGFIFLLTSRHSFRRSQNELSTDCRTRI